MTLVGETTAIELRSVEEMRNFMLLCRLEIQLSQVRVFVDFANYDEIIQAFLKILTLQSFKVCFSY